MSDISITSGKRNDDERTWKELAARWLFGQDVSTVLLVGILLSLWFFGWYAMTKAIPDHIQSIQMGYEKIEKGHTDDLKETRAANEALVRYIVDGFKEATRRGP